MLQIKNISKQYKTGNLIQDALKDVSVNFRDNEFVAILGPSGSGKTTLLNIIGGLDRYDSGNLIINNIATDKYKDRDWDSYRNHTIGFVFQSYYLIPHQTVLSNVELALTISGISKAERRKRALEALEQVGLKEQAHKKPTQMSGGQMQRVAIARALVNNPSILLADEPTGALDTNTSIQVMELLKQVAKDRLVVMVTHNPELANQYATRIIRLQDGEIIDDNMPYEPETEAAAAESEPEEAAGAGADDKTAPEDKFIRKNMGRSTMSILTSLGLSFNNLKTKKARTLLTAIAGSIGIIGIALILSISTGVNNYIYDIQKDTMTSYPITINEQNMDMSAFMNMGNAEAEDGDDGENGNGGHELDAVYSTSRQLEMSNMMTSSITTNNLTLFKEYLDDGNSEIHQYLSDEGVVYSYDLSFEIFAYDPEGEFFNTNPYAYGQTIQNGMGSYSMITDVNPSFSEMLPGGGDELISAAVTDAYECIYGRWPSNYDEVVLVINPNNELDLEFFYNLGYLPQEDYLRMIEQFTSMNEITFEDVVLDYDTILAQKLYLFTASDKYVEIADGIFENQAATREEAEALVGNALELNIVGIIRPVDMDKATIMTPVAYTHALSQYMMEHTIQSDVVRAQIENPDINVTNGFAFDPAGDEQKIDDVRLFFANMTISQKADYFDEIMTEMAQAYGSDEITAQLAQMTETEKAETLDGYMQQATAEDLIEFYDEHISAGSYSENMDLFGYVDEDTPSSISLYTDTFENKDKIAECIENYNESVDEADRISYTDYIGLLLSSVTTIIDVISYVLIAFVAVALVVSSIMIGIITFISVLERTKEIGILRAIGASKRNISQVFNAETFIIGLLSGLLGIGLTELFLIPINMVIHALAGTTTVNAVLNPLPAVILICLSVVLTLIGGIIPSKKAAKMDPVAALKSE